MRSRIENLRVSASSKVHPLAGAIANIIRRDNALSIDSIGAKAVNQSLKAIIIAREFLKEDYLDLYVQPSFIKLNLQGEERSAIKFIITSQTII